MVTRRTFLQVGLAGTALLALAGACEKARPAAGSLRFLDADSAALLAAVVPVVLAGALPADEAPRRAAVREVVEAFDRAVAGLAPAVQDEIDELLGTLRFRPARLLVGGPWAPLHESPPERIAALLDAWRGSGFDLLRAGYQALTQLVFAAWYDNPSAWPAIGYPGPPAIGKP
ncbi:MAG TPA: hypothetical protein VFK48_14785 [Usitatibacter sp.]|nr:hypothetical protein [Usitatibacter sp.]